MDAAKVAIALQIVKRRRGERAGRSALGTGKTYTDIFEEALDIYEQMLDRYFR